MLRKTFIDPLLADKHELSVQEERRLNALYLAMMNNKASLEFQFAQADKIYDWLYKGSENKQY